jgi:hypothetical protein
MARRNRPSQVKREREQKKRARQQKKAERAAEKRARRFGQEEVGAKNLNDEQDMNAYPQAEDIASGGEP